MYNFALAFVLCAVVYLIGDLVSTASKAWIPSAFITAAVVLIGYNTVLPQTLVTDAGLIPFGSTIGVYLLITHMGTVISIKQLVAQWKTIVVCLAGLVGMCALALLVAPLFMDRSFVISGLPPLTGGIVAATTMMDAAKEAGLMEAAVFAIAMFCVQGFAGYPLTAVCLQLEGKKLLKDYRMGQGKRAEDTASFTLDGAPAKRKLLPPIPDKWNSTVMMLGKTAFVAWLATLLGGITIPLLNMKISGAVWALVLGILFNSIGFLEDNILNRANSYGILMFALMMYIFDGLKDLTMDMFFDIIGPMVILIIIGVIGMAILSFIASKVLKISFPMALATALTALYGFPPNAVITENTCKALAETPEEKEYLMSHMFPPMIVGGFTTVTITSVIIAGVFAGMF